MPSFHLSRRTALIGLGSAAAFAGAGSFALLTRGRKPPHNHRKKPPEVPSASSSWTERVGDLHQQINRGDFPAAADSASHLAGEVFERADRVVQAWLRLRDQYRGFLPRRIDDSRQLFWNYQDCAADMYCHYVIEASLIAPRHLLALRDLLEKERAITKGVPAAIRLDTGALVGETIEQRIFGAVEYAKDGLLPILERVGPTEWLDRMHEVVDAVIASSPFDTRYGRLPSNGTEKNGEFLQVLSRLYHRERRPEHLAMGRAIADAYTREILPQGGGLPAQIWNFAEGKPVDQDLRLRDHNNEIIAGLAEWITAESAAPASHADQYRDAVEGMMDFLLDRGRDTAGLWLDHVLHADQAPPPPPPRPANDNWGYLTAGYVGYALSLPESSARRQRYLAESTRAFAAAIQYHRAAWEGGKMDGHADTIESALYLMPFIKVDSAARWVDDEIGVLMAYQKDDGIVGGTYLDGNFVRTALAYALFRTQGTRPDPWQPGLRLGAIRIPQGLQIAVSSSSPWSGRILFDRARHREHLNLPYEYPRLNGWTEWFTANPNARYKVQKSNGESQETATVTGSELINGLAVDVSNERVLQVTVSLSG